MRQPRFILGRKFLNNGLPPYNISLIGLFHTSPNTYDHRVWKTGLPVRSAVLKPHAGELVVGWVTTSESSLLYVFLLLCFLFFVFSFLWETIHPPRRNERMAYTSFARATQRLN